FGDGTTGSGAQPSHIYGTADQFTVTLTVSDGRGGSHATTALASVAQTNRAPTASAGGPYSGDAGSPIGLSAIASDADQDALTYAWDFGDGSQGSGPSPSHVYAAQGTYAIVLSVTDGHGGAVAAISSAVVGAAADRAPPVVKLSAATTALPGTQTVVTAQATDNVGVASVSFDVDGAASSQVTTAPYQRTVDIPSLATPGSTVKVKATARDAANNAGSDEVTITIAAAPDTTSPTVSIQLPPQASPGATIVVSAAAADAGGVQLVSFSSGGVAFASDGASPYSVLFTIPPDTAPGSTLAFVARAVDFANNFAESSGQVTIVATPDTQPPTVTLTAPGSVVQGSTLRVTATAADNVQVASVDFLVDDVVIGSAIAPPFAAEMTAGRPAGSVLRVRAVARDSSGNQAFSDRESRVVSPAASGAAVVTGRVYDDASGLPLAGASVALNGSDGNGQRYTATATSDNRGAYFLNAASGHGTLTITRAGWTRVDRPVDVPGSEALTVFDARLTPLAAVAQTVPAIVGGTVQGGDASLTIVSGGLAADAALTVTVVGQQGVEGALPLGWSPAGVVDITPHGVVFTGAQALSLANRLKLPTGTSLIVAGWDEAASAWRAVAVNPVAADASRLDAAILSSGQYAWLAADALPAVPAAPAPGALLDGVARADVPDPAAIHISPQPKVLFYTPGVNSTVGVVLDSQLPSGTPLRSRIVELYTFTSAGEARPDPLEEDLVFYQRPGPAKSVSAGFVVTPSLTFDPLDLQQGVITVELTVPLESHSQPSVGPAGGIVSTATGETLEVAANAFSTSVPVEFVALTPATLGITLPPELSFIGAASVAFAGASPGAPAVLSIPRPPQVDGSSPIVLLRLAMIEGKTRLLLVGVGRVVGTRIVSDSVVPGAAATLDGVTAPGRYVFVRGTSGLAFATGIVTGSDGHPLPQALVSASGLPIVALTDLLGRYVVPVGVGPVTITAKNLQNQDTHTIERTAAAGSVVSGDVPLSVLSLTITSLTPVEGATSVALSAAIVATFSAPIDPATLTGPSGSSIVVKTSSGAVVSGAITVSAGNTKATFRPSSLLAPNLSFTATVSTDVKDLVGRPLSAGAVTHFTSLDTTPPVAPAAGSITATIPDASGFTTVTATQGTAGAHDDVSIVNKTKKTSFPATVAADGSFSATFAVALGDKLQVSITDKSGNQTVVALPAFTRTNVDGSMATVVGSEGGHLLGPAGIAVDVPAGAFGDGTVVTIGSVGEAAFPVHMTAAQKQFFGFAGGLTLDFGGATPSIYLNVSFPAQGGETRDDRWIVGQVATVNGAQILTVADTARIIDGRITTSSPPCPGVQAAATYGLLKPTAMPFVGVAYGRFPAPNTSLYAAQIMTMSVSAMSLGSFGFAGIAAMPLTLPYQLLSTPVPADVCIPVLSGRVTVQPNSQKVVITADQFTPADREIVVRNQKLGRDFHYPRNVAEYRFTVDGTADDAFRVNVVSNGKEQPVTFDLVNAATPGLVTLRLNMNTLTAAVSEIVIRNISKNPVQERRFPQSGASVKIAVEGGVADGFEVSVVDTTKTSRSVQFTVESPSGQGNLLARAVPVTIDPDTDVFIERHDGTNWDTILARVPVPAGVRQFGGFELTFDGNAGGGGIAPDVFLVVVEYHDGRPRDSIAIPNVAITVSNAATGRVIKTLSALIPPPDEPFNLGVINLDDHAPPIMTAAPPQLNNFDPSAFLEFTFSEGIDRASALHGVVMTDAAGAVVTGQVRLSNENTVVTFVPDAPLQMATSYTIRFDGLVDNAGNAFKTTTQNVTTFTPKATGPPFTAGEALSVLRYLTLYKKTSGPGPAKTLGFGITGDLGESSHKLVILDLTDPRQPVLLSTVNEGDLQRVTVVPGVQNLALDGTNPCGGGTSFSGDLAITSSYTAVGSAVRFFDVSDPSTPCQMGSKLLTLNPAFSNFPQGVVLTPLASARAVVAMSDGSRLKSYTAMENVGLMMADVGHNVPAVLPDQRVREPIASGNYTDVVVGANRLLAIERTAKTLDTFDASLAQSSSVPLPLGDAIAMTYAEGISIDVNGDGDIGQDEVLSLAFVGGTGGVVILDATNPDAPVILGTVPMKGAVYQMDFDADKRRLFVSGPTELPDGNWAVSMIDLSGRKPFTSSGPEGPDTRLTWHTPAVELYGLGISNYRGLRFDADRRMLYVGVSTDTNSHGGLEVWSLDNTCCDLGADFTAKPRLSSGGTGERPELLAREKKVLQAGLGAGLAAAASCGVPIRSAGVADSPGSLAILEQGSGACLWKGNPLVTCSDSYQPGLSDHDYEVLIPASFFSAGGAGSAATCVTDALNGAFTNTDGTPKEIDAGGVKMSFDDITFFAVSRSGFDAAKLDVLPPKSSGGDITGDLGLGRQQLLLKWLLEGEYVTVPGYEVGGKSLDLVLSTLRTTTGIPALEGHEWGTLQKFNLVKSRAFIRIAGSSTTGTSLHDIYIAQVHDTGKAGIRAALARMVADPAANALVLNITRAEFASNGCRNINPASLPAEWNPKACNSFEEYVASAAARSLSLPAPPFDDSVVANTIHWFYRVKANVKPFLKDEAEADRLIATASIFIDKVIADTKVIYDSTIGGDADQAQRQSNLQTAQTKTDDGLTGTNLHIVPRFFNHGFVGASAVLTTMYRGSDGVGTAAVSRRVDLAGGEQKFAETDADILTAAPDGISPADRNLNDLDRLDVSLHKPTFLLGSGELGNPKINQEVDPGQLRYVAFTIDLPEKKVKEPNRLNNVDGFWYYILDRSSEEVLPPTIPPSIPLPVADPDGDLLKPDLECGQTADLQITQSFNFGGTLGELTDPATLEPGETIGVQITVRNESGKVVKDVVACSSLAPDDCRPIGTLGIGEQKVVTVNFTSPEDARTLEAIALASSPDVGVRQSDPRMLMVGCEASQIAEVPDFPNPDFVEQETAADVAKVMIGGNAVRYFNVVNRRTGQRVAGAQVTIEVTGPGGTKTMVAGTNANGRIETPQTPYFVSTPGAPLQYDVEPGLVIPVASTLNDGDRLTVTLKSVTVNGKTSQPFCSAMLPMVIPVGDRDFKRSWNAGASIAAEGAIEVGLAGKIAAGMAFTIAEKAKLGRQQLTLVRTAGAEGGFKETLTEFLDAKASFSVGGATAKAQVGAGIEGTAVAQLMLGDQYDFKFVPGTPNLDKSQSVALGGLMLASLVGFNNPIITNLVQGAVQATGLDMEQYRTATTAAVGAEVSTTGTASAVAGIVATKASHRYGEIAYGLEASASLSGKAGATMGVEFKSKPTTVITPSVELRAGVELGVALGVGIGSPTPDPNDAKAVAKAAQKVSLGDKLKAGLKGSLGGKFGASLALDQNLKPTSLTISLSGSKTAGLVVSGSNFVLGTGGQFTGTAKGTIKFTTADPVVMQKAIAQLQTVAKLNSVIAVVVPGAGVPIALVNALTQEVTNLVELLVSNDFDFEITEEIGDGEVLPIIGVDLAALGLKLKVSDALALDRAIAYTTEKGRIRGGVYYPLARYTKDALIPDLPVGAANDAFQSVGALAMSSMSDAGKLAVDRVAKTAVAGLDSVRSHFTAQLDFNGTNEPPFEIGIVSTRFTAIPGSLAPRLQPPNATSGPADRPHYGIGHFHQFTPDGRALASPATLTIFYNEDEVTAFDKSTFGIYRWNDATSDWDYLGGVNDSSTNTIRVTVDRLGLFTAAPPMPAGAIALIGQATRTGSGLESHVVASYTSAPLRMNNGQPVPDGTLYTVMGVPRGAPFVSFGTVIAADEDPSADGVQVRSHNGVIQFTVDYPVAADAVTAAAFASSGTAFGLTVVTVPPQP
ncbi:MAG: hypothetical protein JWL71_729, partial [Acidobacteria bacterium]|nr:hypothetical protein [Acidobacteriota bacterium]